MRVIIIGAGIAGLTAANRLQQLGVDVIVLEARNRSGGRVCKAEEFDIPIDLGASWIHGVTGNPLHDVAQRLGLKLDVTDNPSLTSHGMFEVYDEEDGHLVDPEIDLKMRERFEELTKVGRQFMEALGKDLPLETVLQLDDDEKITKKELRFFNWLKTGVEGWENTHLSNLSARGHYWENENNFTGGDGFVIDGFWKIVHAMGADLEEQNRILLNHVVSSIHQDENSVTVKTNQGDYTADYAITTFPLGVLKSGSVEFQPPLPSWKTTAIERVGFGLMNKIVLEFEDIFWREDIEGIGYVSDHRGEFNFFLNMYPFTKRPILMGFVAADFAHLIETWTDEDITQKVMNTLNKIYGKNRELPSMVRCKVTRWGGDPFARGSYSFLAYGSSLDDIVRLGMPVGRVHFAGEATFKPLGFTHGAYLSGIREAERVKEATIKKSMPLPSPSKSIQIPMRHPSPQPMQAMMMSKL